jgi:hypothetical protein
LVAAVTQSRANTTDPVFATPAGWTKIGSTESSTEGATKVYFAQFYKVASGSETTVAFNLTNAGLLLAAVVQEFDGFTGTPTLDSPSIDWINSDQYTGSATNNLLTNGGWTAAGTNPELAVAHVGVAAAVTGLTGSFTGASDYPFSHQLIGGILGAGWVSAAGTNPDDNEYSFMWTTARDCVMQGALFYNVALPPSSPGTSKYLDWEGVLNALAGTQFLDSLQAANIWAGTSNLGMIAALNIKAGNGSNPKNWLGLNGVCNQLAGLPPGNGLDAVGALNYLAGNQD